MQHTLQLTLFLRDVWYNLKTCVTLHAQRILTIVGERQGEQEAAVPYQRAVSLCE
jgi:hypothetical protein